MTLLADQGAGEQLTSALTAHMRRNLDPRVLSGLVN